MSTRTEIFQEVFSHYETPEMRAFAEELLDKIPENNFTMPSSTSYKYHNVTQCQPGGQLYHVIMACTLMNYTLELEYMMKKFENVKQRDCLRIAMLFHDCIKTGNDNGQYTVHDHPILAGEFLCKAKVEHDIDEKYKTYIARLMASHSGQWISSNKSSVVLPKPENDAQFLVHQCDYLASRSNLDMIYDDKTLSLVQSMQTLPSVEEWKIPFGKYKDYTLKQVALTDPGYITWAKANIEKEPMKSLLKQL